MTVNIRYLMHRWTGRETPDSRVLLTACGRRFVPGASVKEHDPARARCPDCYPTVKP